MIETSKILSDSAQSKAISKEPESSKGLKFGPPKTTRTETFLGLKVDTQTEGLGL